MYTNIPCHAIHLISYHNSITFATVVQFSFIPYHAISLSPLTRLHTSHTSKCPFTYMSFFQYTHLFIQNMDKVRSSTDRTSL